MGTRYKGTAEEVSALNAFIALSRAADSALARAFVPVAELGLTPSQFGALEALYFCGPMCPGDLARKMMRSNGSVTSVVDGLVRRGWALREKIPGDRRFRTLKLTARGSGLVRRAMPAHVELIRRQFAVLTAAERETLRALCRAVGTGSR